MIQTWFQSQITPFQSVAIGQIQWTVAGTYQWTVPPGVTSVNFAMIGGGQSGNVQYVSYQNTGYRGYGGMTSDYVFRNNITVTPGQVLTIVVGSGGTNRSAGSSTTIAGDGGGTSSAFGVTTGGYSGVMSYGPLNGTKYGNDAGTALDPDGIDVNGTGKGVDLKTGLATNRVNNEGASCGGGGSGTYNGSGSKTKGGDGGVRIIWGPGRAFPSTNTGDM